MQLFSKKQPSITLAAYLSSKENNLGIIRLLAAVLVVYGHCYPLTDYAHPQSHTLDPFSLLFRSYMGFGTGLAGQAVCIFFFISGLLITKSFHERKGITHFCVSRALRIYPALWVNILFCLLLWAWLHPAPLTTLWATREAQDFALYHGTLIKPHTSMLSGVLGHLPWSAMNGSLWTLPHEMKMYVFCGVLGLIGLYKHRGMFNLLFCAVMLFFLTQGDFGLLASVNCSWFIIYFLIGMAAYVNASIIPLNWKTGMLLLAISLFIHSLPLPKDYYNLAFAFTLSYAIALLGFIRYIRKLDIGRFGDFSYGVYLYGFPLQQWIIHSSLVYWNQPITPLPLFIATLLALLPFAIGSWFLIEKPALGLKRKAGHFRWKASLSLPGKSPMA